MRAFIVFLLTFTFIFVLTTAAFAGIAGTVSGWLTGEVIALIASAVLAAPPGVDAPMPSPPTEIKRCAI